MRRRCLLWLLDSTEGLHLQRRITDTGTRPYRNKDYEKVIAAQEKEKKDKYLHPCQEHRKNFTPLVYSVDGI